MAYSIARKFHPFALLASMGIFLLIMLNLNNNTPLNEKLLFLGIAGAIYFLILTFESWRINQN